MGKAQPYESEGQNIIIFPKKEQFMPDYIYLCRIRTREKLKRMNKAACIMAVTVMAMSACKTEETKTPAIDLTNLDTEVLPSEDFYRYATGGWMKKNPLKPEYARYGVFNVLADNNEKRLSELFNEVSASAPVPKQPPVADDTAWNKGEAEEEPVPESPEQGETEEGKNS